MRILALWVSICFCFPFVCIFFLVNMWINIRIFSEEKNATESETMLRYMVLLSLGWFILSKYFQTLDSIDSRFRIKLNYNYCYGFC